jgi:hypothetical protein
MHIRATANWLALALASVALPPIAMAQPAEPSLGDTDADGHRAPELMGPPDELAPSEAAESNPERRAPPAERAAQDAAAPPELPYEAIPENAETPAEAHEAADLAQPSEDPARAIAEPVAGAETALPEADAPEAEAIVEMMIPSSEAALQMANWVIATRDHEGMPFMVIDKVAAEVLVFDAHGRLLGMTPALFGVTPGDDSAPGVGDRELSDIKPEDRTTPAGRFVAKFGYARGDEKVLWVDYETSISLHPVVTGNQRERRLQRLDSPSPEDNRITFGCINVPAFFYAMVVDPLFEASTGIVYILPELKPMGDVFPAFRGEEPAQPEALAQVEAEEPAPSPAIAQVDEVAPPQDVAQPDEVPPPGDADRPDELSPAEAIARAEVLSRPSVPDAEEPRDPVDEPRTKRPYGPMEDEGSVLIAW